MSRIFNFEGPVFSFLSRLADLFWLNLLFLVCSLPIITIGAASTALYYVTLKMAKDEEGYITRSFFKSFKENFAQATAIWAMALVLSIILILDLRIVNGGNLASVLDSSIVSNVIIISAGVILIVAVMTLTYVFPLLAQFDNSVKNTIKNSFLISIRHLPYTFLMIVIAAIPVVLIWFSPAMFLLVMIVFSGVAYIKSKFLNKIFALYMPKKKQGEEASDPAEDFNGEG